MKCKKLLAILTFSTLIGSMFVGCGSQQQAAAPAQTPASTQTPASNPVVNLVYARGQDTTGATKQIVDEFNQKYQGKIHVDVVDMPSDTGKQHDQYVTVFSAKGTDYDVIDGDVIWPAEFAQAGYALPLDQLVQKDGINMNDYMQGPVQALTFKGQLWGMPKFIDAGVMFYRKDLVQTPPATWDDLYKQAEALKGKAKFGFVGQGKQYEGLVCNATEFIAGYGGQVVDGNGNITIKSDATKSGLEEMKKIFTSDFVPKDITNFTEPETDNAFIAGDVAIARNWPYQWAEAQDASKSKIVDKVGVAALPKGSVRAAAALGGWVTMINKYSKHPNEAWEFVKFMCGPEGQKITATVGGSAPTLLSVYNDPDVQKNPLFGNKDFVNGLSAAVSRPVSPIYPKLSDIMQKEISKYLAGSENVDTALNNMDTQMKQAVQDANK